MLRWDMKEPTNSEKRVFFLSIENGEYEARFENLPKETYEQVLRETDNKSNFYSSGSKTYVIMDQNDVNALFQLKDKGWDYMFEYLEKKGVFKEKQ